MPLNKEALALPAEAAAVSLARQWVAAQCGELGRSDLVECAELAVSELVTNALLHGTAPYSVRLRGTLDHPRVEVYDASTDVPTNPTPPLDDDDLLMTFGRGLSMVSMASEAWGAAVEPGGKCVWFEPAAELHDDAFRPGVIDVSAPAKPWAANEPTFTVHLLGADLRLGRSVRHHYQSLRRELRLLALSHHDEYPLAAELSTMFTDFDEQFDPDVYAQYERLQAAGQNTGDLVLRARLDAPAVFTTILEMLDLADAFCRAERLLSLARAPEQRRYQIWFLGEYIRQQAGQAPMPWQSSGALPRQRAVGQHVS